MPNWTSLKNKADSMLAKYGMLATLKQPNKGTFDPDAGEYTGGSADTETAVNVVKLLVDRTLIDGSMIKQGDVLFLVSAKNINTEPRPGTDTLVVGGTEYQIIDPVRPLDPAGVVVYYELQARA
jgi:hypothetical protein